MEEPFKSLFVPMVVGCASLIAFLSVRNASISDRIRKSNDEIIKSKNNRLPDGRVDNLVKQINLFKPRYRRNNQALNSAIIAILFFFVWMICLVAAQRFPEIPLWWGVWLTFSCGFVCLAVGLWFTYNEIHQSHETLNADIEFALKCAESHREVDTPQHPKG